MKTLTGKIAFVSGSSRGIGKAIAIDLAKNGALVLLHASAKSDYFVKTFQAIKKHSPRSRMYFARVERSKEVSQMAMMIKKDFSAIDLLVNNAGVNSDKTFAKMNKTEWDKVIQVNLTGTYHVIKAFLPFINNGGRVVNISSAVAISGSFGQTNYAAAKAGIIGLTKSLCLELAKNQITVNAVCPGYTSTDMLKSVPKKIILERILPKIPLGRVAKPEEIASLVTYLCSAQSGYITGQAITVSGGLV